ncbi:unnamed protein product [Lathyrus sativus]|nr:unnamed protein product [Lathyrus sativus]
MNLSIIAVIQTRYSLDECKSLDTFGSLVKAIYRSGRCWFVNDSYDIKTSKKGHNFISLSTDASDAL